MRPKILGISGSLRNARRGLGNKVLIDDLKSIGSEDALFEYLHQEAETHLKNFKSAGRSTQLAFDELYKNLRKQKGDRGLSNSEVALASALWSCHQLDCDIEHLSLSEHFDESGAAKDLDALKRKMEAAQGFIISTPVYFGDRSSLVQSFINMIREDDDLSLAIKDKPCTGVAVGAKRNGGQETTLIYQLWDVLQLGLVGLGNDSETTSQYGGTGHAGDIGTMSSDKYGLSTSMGAGRRIARVAQLFFQSTKYKMKEGPNIGFLIMQDRDGQARAQVEWLLKNKDFNCNAQIIDITQNSIKRCLACDICPTHIDKDEVYRCIIKTSKDDMSELHPELLHLDALIPVALSPKDRKGLLTNYQKFMERTRYLRRGDYILSDMIVSPLVVQELGFEENIQLRMLTSCLRHHTMLAKPMTMYQRSDKVLNAAEVLSEFNDFGRLAQKVATGRLAIYSDQVEHLKYNPVGYILSFAKDKEDEQLSRRNEMIEGRIAKAKIESDKRLAKV